jgi:hypothetical protein
MKIAFFNRVKLQLSQIFYNKVYKYNGIYLNLRFIFS